MEATEKAVWYAMARAMAMAMAHGHGLWLSSNSILAIAAHWLWAMGGLWINNKLLWAMWLCGYEALAVAMGHGLWAMAPVANGHWHIAYGAT
jgi:hypothetical protein